MRMPDRIVELASAPAGETTPRRRFGTDRLSFWTVVAWGSLLLFVILIGYPLGRLLVASFSEGSGMVGILETYRTTLTKPYYYRGLLNSFILSIAAVVFASLLGVPLGYIVSRFHVPGKLAIRSAVVLTFISPPFIGAYSWILLLGDNGFVRNWLSAIGIPFPSIYGWFGLILVLSLQGMPFMFLMTAAGLRSIDQSIEDGAISLGQTPFRTIRKNILPLMAPSLSTGALLVFVTAFADFGTPSMLGRNLRIFPRLVYEKFINETTGGEFEVASALAIVMIVVSILALAVQRSYARRRSFGQEAVRPLAIRTTSKRNTVLMTVYAHGITWVACLPLAAIIVTSFVGDRPSTRGVWSLTAYRESKDLWTGLLNTVTFTTVATILCVVIGALIGYVVTRRNDWLGRIIDVTSMVPYAIAGVVMGIAFSISFGFSPFFLNGTAAILVLVYVARRLPYSVRSVVGTLSQVGTQTEEASINLGTPPGRTFIRVTVPLIGSGIAAGALLTWATVAREFNATVILYGGSTRTLPVGVFRDVLYGNFASASAQGTLLILVSLIPIILLFKTLGKDENILL